MKKLIVFVLSTIVQLANAQQPTTKEAMDPLFPGKGKFLGGVLTTFSDAAPPPVLIGDVTFGISKKVAIGMVGGTTGGLGLYGPKINVAVAQLKNFRVAFRMTSIYYPERNGTFLFDKADKYVMPWMLSMGSFDAEWRTEKNVRWSLGVGIAETHCIEDMKMWFSCEKHHHTDGGCEEMKPSLIQVYGTLQGSVSIPLSKRLLLRPEVVAVFKEHGLIPKGEFKINFPINPHIRLVYKF